MRLEGPFREYVFNKEADCSHLGRERLVRIQFLGVDDRTTVALLKDVFQESA